VQTKTLLRTQKVDKLSLDEKVDSLIGSGIRILNKAYALEKKPVDIGHGVLLYPSEFHLIETVGKNPAENLTSIASYLGVTKGAISQMVKKVEKKGLIKKVRVPGNKKDIVLELTDFGKEAFEWHKSLHESMETGIRKELERMSDTEIEVFLRVYGHLEGMLDRCMERYR
jgi:DNA-binding MarR family transcriptional regulator